MGTRGILGELWEGLEDVVDAIGDEVTRMGEARRARLQAAARAVGLELDRKGAFVGAIDGVPVRRWPVDRGGKNRTDWWTYTEYTLATWLPGHLDVHPRGLAEQLSEAFGGKDFAVGSPLDKALWVTVAANQRDEARALLLNPTVHDRLDALLGSEAQWTLRGGNLTVGFRGRHDRVGPRGLRLGAEVVRALDRQLLGPWSALARDLGAGLDPAAPSLEGHLGGVPLRVEVRVRKGAPTTWLLAWFAPHLPDATLVQHRDRLPKGEKLGDAILDPMLRAESTDVPELRRRLTTDMVRGPLLEVVHGFPGSSLRHDRVMLRVPGRVGSLLPDRVRLAVELAEALSVG